MTDTPYYNFLDGVNCADRCEAVIALCELIDKLIADIQFLDLECISTRYLLSLHMDEEEGELLRIDILSHLTGRYEGDLPMNFLKSIMYGSGDSMEFRVFFVKMQEACTGNYPCWH